MTQEENFYVVFKLISGENVMGVLVDETDRHVRIDEPICIKTHPVLSTGKETITASPLCQFSKNNTVILEKKHVIFMHPMHHAFISHYNRIVDESHREPFIAADEDEEPEVSAFFVNGTDTLN